MSKIEKYLSEYTKKLMMGLESLPLREIEAFINHLQAMSKTRGRLYIMGNGGSVATGAHFANDLIGISLQSKNLNIQVESLGDNSAVLTGLANDFGFEKSYAKLLENKLQEGDSILLISASGNSKNLLNAVETAKKKGAKVISLVGFDGGILKGLSDICIHTPSELGDYEKSEDLHLLVNHFIRFTLMK